MTASEIIRSEIAARGPIPFERFMDLALYSPGAGYYTRPRDPFGKDGDFFTAEQLQPVFGILISRLLGDLLRRADSNTVIELGPGRGEMAPAFAGFDYRPVGVDKSLPDTFTGAVFANEFFDALPVHLLTRRRGQWREVYVAGTGGDGFAFARNTRPAPEAAALYLERYHPRCSSRDRVEVNLRARHYVEAVSRSCRRGWFVIIDYGYTAREWVRHAHGTLIGYHRHRACDDVLAAPGTRDITAHVAWTPLEDMLREHGWNIERFHTLARVLMDAGERDRFAALFEGCDPREEQRRRLQLKTLLFGMGETFRVLVASKALPK